MTTEEEMNETLKKYNSLIDGLKLIFSELEKNEKKEKEMGEKKKSLKKRDTKGYQLINNHELYKFYLISNFFRGKLTLLDEKQAFDENDSFQKIMNLFLEENETISSIISNKSGDANSYLITQ